MFKRGYVTELEVEGNAFTVTQAELELKVVQTEIDVLNKYTREIQLETLNGSLIANKSKLQADEAGLAMDKARLDRAKEELENCIIKAERSGLVIYPSAAAWKETPDITEGATVRKDQVLLLMPDLTKMQVTVGIHESVVDRMKPGLKARVSLPDQKLEGEVSSVACANPAESVDTNIQIQTKSGIIRRPVGETVFTVQIVIPARESSPGRQRVQADSS